MKFCIRDLLFVTVIVALAVGWSIDHRRKSIEIEKLSHELDVERVRRLGPILVRDYIPSPNPRETNAQCSIE